MAKHPILDQFNAFYVLSVFVFVLSWIKVDALFALAGRDLAFRNLQETRYQGRSEPSQRSSREIYGNHNEKHIKFTEPPATLFTQP